MATSSARSATATYPRGGTSHRRERINDVRSSDGSRLRPCARSFTRTSRIPGLSAAPLRRSRFIPVPSTLFGLPKSFITSGTYRRFAAGLRHVLRPKGHLLIRGGFGPVQELPLYRYFPLAWAERNAVRLTLERASRAAEGR